MRNLQKVQHVSFIAYRSVPQNGKLSFYADGKKIDPGNFQMIPTDVEDMSITTEEMFGVIHNQFPQLKPCAWLNGTTVYETFKFLIIVNLGTKKQLYGNMGKTTIEMAQMFYHLFFRRYFAFLKSPKTGSKIFLLLFFDPQIRKSFIVFLKPLLKNPLSLFNRIIVKTE